MDHLLFKNVLSHLVSPAGANISASFDICDAEVNDAHSLPVEISKESFLSEYSKYWCVTQELLSKALGAESFISSLQNLILDSQP